MEAAAPNDSHLNLSVNADFRHRGTVSPPRLPSPLGEFCLTCAQGEVTQQNRSWVVVTHASNPGTGRAEASRSQVTGQPELHSEFKTTLGCRRGLTEFLKGKGSGVPDVSCIMTTRETGTVIY